MKNLKAAKELLLRDLCARLPYGVKVTTTNNAVKFGVISGISIENKISVRTKHADIVFNCTEVKPYLFPLSSMTEEQKHEYNKRKHDISVCRYEYGDVVEEIELYHSPESFEYLIENHFDYRGLIEKGLAIDCTNLDIY